MSLIKKLVAIQSTLNAPKNQRNNFGKYNYRSCEDILEAVKPLLKEQGLFLFINDEIELIGDRYYVKAVATITDGENSQSATAHAREEQQKKGMDSAQLTGATSSYARKYALNGLFCIDDNKDADSNEQRNQVNAPQRPQTTSAEYLASFTGLISACQSTQACLQVKEKFFKSNGNNCMTQEDLSKAQAVFKTHHDDLEQQGS